MSRSQKLVIGIAAGSGVALILYFLTPLDARPRAIIAIVAIWSAVAFGWRGNTTRGRTILVLAAVVLTLMSLLAFAL